MKLTVLFYPPLDAACGSELLEIEFPDGSTITDVTGYLENRGLLGDYSRNDVLALINNEVAPPRYVLMSGQTVKILLKPMGG